MPRGGKRPGSGRKKGGTNKITADARQAIMEAFGMVGGVEYLVRSLVRIPKPSAPSWASSSPSRSRATRRVYW
jgi:hypothetical protein